jgi:hypothetical protein
VKTLQIKNRLVGFTEKNLPAGALRQAVEIE